MKRETVILVASASLLLVTLGLVYKGCRRDVERFTPGGSLSLEESKLFEDLRADKYTPTQIDHMVSSGVIDQKLVEKFLDRLQNLDTVKA